MTLPLLFPLLVLAFSIAGSEPPGYVAKRWVSGSLRCSGSETMDLVVARWAQEFGRIHPAWRMDIDGKGTRVALRELARGGTDLAVLSRIPGDSEFAALGLGGAARPSLLVVGFDSIHLVARRGEGRDSVPTASAFRGEGGSLRPFGRNLSSGTRAAAASALVAGKEFASSVRSLSSPSLVAQAVASDPRAVGYAGGGFALARIEPVGVPLGRRPLVLAFRRRGSKVDALREFLAFVHSAEGARILRASGFQPVPADSMAANRARAGLDG